MGVLDGLANAAKQADAIADGQLVFIGVSVKRQPVDKVHDEVRPPVRSRAAIDQPRDKGMIQCGEYLPLIPKTSENEIGIDAALYHLDRHFEPKFPVSP